MKFLIVGLGNPGLEYENTRHNIGFSVVEALAKEHDVAFTLDRAAYRTDFKYRGKTIIMIKPTTFMNLSGKAVNYWLQKEQIPIEHLLVITDDLALPFGTIRLKGSGSDGGHNGLKDIQATLQTHHYARLRFGIGSDFPKGYQSEYVLGRWSTEESTAILERLNAARQTCLAFCSQGLQMAMNQYNGK